MKNPLPNALMPVVTLGGSTVIGLLGGVVIVEVVFNYPGMGSAFASAAVQLDNNEPLRLRWLASTMQEPRSPDPDMLTVVVVAAGHAHLGLVVHRVLGEEDLVIKPLPWNFARLPGTNGVCGVSLILFLSFLPSRRMVTAMVSPISLV